MSANTDLPSPAGLDWDYLRVNCYRSEPHRLAYVATPKVACTSLKWWFAKLGGYAQAIRKVTDSEESEPDLVIHDSFHKIAPEVTGLSPETLRETLESDSYFKFAVVRNPYKRIFSAWQSKLMLREPIQSGRYVGRDFFHHAMSSMNDIASSLEAFLEHLATNEAPSFWDFHWAPQVRLLRPDLIAYSCVAKIEHAETLTKRLSVHLGPAVPNPFEGQAANEGLIPYCREFITGRSAELIRSLYAEDFSEFHYDDEPPQGKGRFAHEQYDVALKAVKMLRGRHQQIALQRAHASVQLGALTASLAVADNELMKYRHQAAEYDRLLVDANLRVAALDGDGRQLRQILATVQDRAAALEVASEDRIAEHHHRVEGLKSRIIALEEENRALQVSLGTAESQLNAFADRLSEAQDDGREMACKLEESDARVVVLEGERRRLVSALQGGQLSRDGGMAEGPEAAQYSLVQCRSSDLASLRFLLRRMARVLVCRVSGRQP